MKNKEHSYTVRSLSGMITYEHANRIFPRASALPKYETAITHHVPYCSAVG